MSEPASPAAAAPLPQDAPVEVGAARRLAGFVEFVRFVATGSIAAVANLVARYLFNFVVTYEVAVVLGYLVGMVIAFYLFQRLIFSNPTAPLRRRMIRFTQVNLLGLGLTELTSVALARGLFPMIDWTFRPLDVAHFIGVAAPAFSSYFLHKYYTFR